MSENIEVVKVPKSSSPPPLKRKREESVILLEQARKAFYAFKYLGMTRADAYSYAKPATKSKTKQARATLGGRLVRWYESHGPQDMKEALELFGLTPRGWLRRWRLAWKRRQPTRR